MGLSDTAIMVSACWRPYYLEQTLGAWSRARGFSEIRAFHVGLGYHERIGEMQAVIDAFAEKTDVPVSVHVDNPRVGPWRAIAALGNKALEDQETEFLIYGDEDTFVAEDVLELICWERDQLDDRPDVLLVNAHSRCGQGWDGPDVRDDPDADPAVVRLLPYFTPWGWGTWRDCWEDILIKGWDYDGSSGHPMRSGFDWNVQLRTMRGYVAAVPDASRTQHIGDREGMFSTQESLAFSKSASFRQQRDPVEFRLEPADPAVLAQIAELNKDPA